jgi:anti-anti-sigma factor
MEPHGNGGDTRATRLALIAATILIAQQVAGKATRDALFLSNFEVTQLPKAVIAAGVLSILGVLGVSGALARVGPARLIPIAFGSSAALYLLEWGLMGIVPRAASLMLYLHVAAFSAILISGFWSLITERFDPYTAKRAIARVATAATLGGVAGGLISKGVASLIDLQAMLMVLAGMHGACALLVARIGQPRPAPTPGAQIPSGIRLMAKTPYLQRMALLTAAIAVMGALLDYGLKAEAAMHFQGAEALVGFFAAFYAATGLGSFLLQGLLGPRTLQRLGLGGTLSALPIAVILIGLIGTAMPRLWAAVALRGVQSVLSNSFHRSGSELLYSPLAPDTKRPTKTLIDVGADRAGDIIGAGVVLGLIGVLGTAPTALVVALAMALAALTLALVIRLQRGYVGQLAHSLRTQPMPGPPEPALPESPPAQGPSAATPSPGSSSPAQGQHLVDPDSIVRAIRVLRGGDRAQILSLLQVGGLRPELVPHTIPLLRDAQLMPGAVNALSEIAPKVVGQLVDAMLDPDTAVEVRRRIPRVLASCDTQRAIDGLLSGLTSEAFGVRYRCGLALDHALHRHPNLFVSQEAALSAVQRELEVGAGTGGDPHGGAAWDKEQPRILEHLFNLLGLVLDRETIRLTLEALKSGDRNLKGTALEYLENVLPEAICRPLWGHISGVSREQKAARPTREIAQELKRSGTRLAGRCEGPPAYGISEHGAHSVITLAGEVDLNTSPRARDQILELIRAQHPVLVDLTRVSYMDSSGLAALVEGLQLARRQGLEFALVGVGQSIIRVLRLARLDKVFTIYASLQEVPQA